MKTTLKLTIVLAMLGIFAMSAQAQLPAPFAGGVKLQQAGLSNQSNGIIMKASVGGFAGGDNTLTWLPVPATNGILKFVNTGAGAGTIGMSALDLTADVGASILPILNGGTNSNVPLSGSSIMISDGTHIIQGQKGTATTVLHGNGSGAPTYSAVDMAADVTGTLPILNGGTNNNAIGAAGTVVFSDGAKHNFTAVGNAGQLLKSNGAGTPTWVDASSFGITSIVGTAPITANTVSGVTTLNLLKDATMTLTGVSSDHLGIDLTHANTWTGDQTLNVSAGQAASLVASLNASTAPKTLKADVINYDGTLTVASNKLGLNLSSNNTWVGNQLLPANSTQGDNVVAAVNAGTTAITATHGGTGSTAALTNNQIMVSKAGTIVEGGVMNDGQIMIGKTGGAPIAAALTAGNGITIQNAGNSITISANTNNFNKAIIALNNGQVSYTGNTIAGFALSATSVITITVFEKGGYPITATVTNIDAAGNKFDFVLSGYPTALSTALVAVQN